MGLFSKVMVANRGEIAVRIIRACKELCIPTVTVFTAQDANAIHITKADQAILVSPGPVAGYLDYHQIIDVAKWAGADAVHPGYGFSPVPTSGKRPIKRSHNAGLANSARVTTA